MLLLVLLYLYKKQKTRLIMSVVAVVVAVVIAIGGIVAVSFNKCDDCGASFFGSGYYKEKAGEGVLGSLFGSLLGDTGKTPLETEEDVVICLECAKKNTSVVSELRDVSEFKR
jgi:hypothetical protein